MKKIKIIYKSHRLTITPAKDGELIYPSEIHCNSSEFNIIDELNEQAIADISLIMRATMEQQNDK